MARTTAARTAKSATSPLWSRLQAALAPDYRLERELGGGGMSRVFLATRSDSRLVAVKVLADSATDLLELRRFRQEIAITTALRHPHILPVLASGEEAGLAWFITPFVAEGSLRDLLRYESPLAIARSVRLLSDIAEALACAHACGVVHGDLKPENVLLSNGRALLADFGGARLRLLRRAVAAGEPEAPVIGTPLYMSPEQAAGETSFDGRADLYSLGVLAWELLTGNPPFTAADPRSVLLAHLGAPVPSLRAHRADVPDRLSLLVERMLAKDPDARPRSAFVVRTALDGALEPAAPRVAAARRIRSRRSAGRAWMPIAVSAATRAAAALLATVLTGGALAAAAGMLPDGDAPSSDVFASAGTSVYGEPVELPRLQELDALVIEGERGVDAAAERSRTLASAEATAVAAPRAVTAEGAVAASVATDLPVGEAERIVAVASASHRIAPPAAVMRFEAPAKVRHPAAAPHAPPPAPPAPPPAPRPASSSRREAVVARAVGAPGTVRSGLSVSDIAELQRAAAVLGLEAGKLAMHVVKGEGKHLVVGDTLIRLELEAAHAEVARELAAARVVLGTSVRRFEVRAKQDGRTIEVVVPCVPAPPPVADCGTPIAVPATRPVGA